MPWMALARVYVHQLYLSTDYSFKYLLVFLQTCKPSLEIGDFGGCFFSQSGDLLFIARLRFAHFRGIKAAVSGAVAYSET